MVVVWLFLAIPRACMQFVIVVFPDHTHLFFSVSEGFALSVLLFVQIKDYQY